MRYAILLLLLVSAVPALADTWSPYTSSDGRFRALVPVPPEEKVVRRSTPVGELVIRNLASVAGSTSLTVTYVDVPRLGVALLGRDGVFDKAAETVLQKRKGTLRGTRDLEVQGQAGREITYVAGDGREGRSRIVLVGNRLYVVDSAVPEGGPEGGRFLDSFEVL